MSYKALYRTYRPSSFDEVAGQQHIIQTLKNAISENKIAHAYLFCGPRGTGKTSVARLFAKALNCEEGMGHQCSKCDNCVSIAEGSHPDVIELDAASNRGIDDIRDLIEKVRYAPIRGGYKVYIIDEVHMLTTEAFNALLKTLEEPPHNVVFILATTEPYKLMPTILSRCQRYDFMKVSNVDLLARLKDIVEQEGVTVSDEALSLIISLSDGGVRDALSMLDQALAYAGDNLEAHHINEIFGLSSKEDKIKLLLAIQNKDYASITSINNENTQKGIDVKRLTLDLLDILKDILIARNTKDITLLKVLDIKDVGQFTFTNKQINELIDILLSASTQYRFVASASSLYEISLLKMVSCLQDEIPSVTISQVAQKQEIKAAPEIKARPVPQVDPVKTFAKRSEVSDLPLFTEQGTLLTFGKDDILNIMVQANKEEKKIISDIWGDLENVVNDDNSAKYVSILKPCFVRVVAKDAIVLESTFENLANRINTIENQLGFKKIIKAVTGRDYIVVCLTHEQYVESVNRFTELLQAKKLPSPKPIELVSAQTSKVAQKTTPSVSETELLAKELTKEE